MIPAAARPFLAAILAPLTLWICGHLALRFGIIFTEAQQQQFVDFVLDYVLPAFAANGVLRMLYSKWTNPSNSATTQLAEAGREQNAQIRSADKTTAAAPQHVPLDPLEEPPPADFSGRPLLTQSAPMSDPRTPLPPIFPLPTHPSD